MSDFNWNFPEGMKRSGRSLREVCEEAQEDFFRANGYYPTEEEAVRMTDEVRKKIAEEEAGKKLPWKRPMDYLYKITVWVDNDRILNMKQHDLNEAYQTIREIFADCNFKEQPTDDGTLVFTIGEGEDSFSEVEIVANALYFSWLGKCLKKLERYDLSDDSTEDILKDNKEFDEKYGKKL